MRRHGIGCFLAGIVFLGFAVYALTKGAWSAVLMHLALSGVGFGFGVYMIRRSA
jgi:uncharacterized membrane protein